MTHGRTAAAALALCMAAVPTGEQNPAVLRAPEPPKPQSWPQYEISGKEVWLACAEPEPAKPRMSREDSIRELHDCLRAVIPDYRPGDVVPFYDSESGRVILIPTPKEPSKEASGLQTAIYTTKGHIH